MGIKLLDNIFKKQSTQTNTTQPTYPDFDIQNGILVKYYGTGGKVIIPTEVNAIGKNAFSGCNTLTDVEIPNTVTSIGESAFYNCMALKSITIPSSIKSIGDWAFTGCLNLKAVCNLLNAGKAIFVEDMQRKDGELFSSYVKLDEATGRPNYTRYNPDSPEGACRANGWRSCRGKKCSRI